MTTITFLPRATATQDENKELESSTSCSLDNDNKDDNSYHWKFLLAKTSRSRKCCDVAHPMFLNGTSAIHVLRRILQLGFTLHHTPPGEETTDLLNPDMSVRTSVAGRRGHLSIITFANKGILEQPGGFHRKRPWVAKQQCSSTCCCNQARRPVATLCRWEPTAFDARALGRDPRVHRGGTWANFIENRVKLLHIVSYQFTKSHPFVALASVGDPRSAPSAGPSHP